jgi:hypothetical protein
MICNSSSASHSSRWKLFAAAVVAMILQGCGDGRPERVPVSGRVLIDGQPLAHGSVMFVPDHGRSAGGSLDKDGRFTLTCYEPNDGVIPGKYRVKVSGVEFLSETSQKWHAPKKYADERTSGFEFEIQESTDSIVLELEWGEGKPFIERF